MFSSNKKEELKEEVGNPITPFIFALYNKRRKLIIQPLFTFIVMMDVRFLITFQIKGCSNEGNEGKIASRTGCHNI
ncbi:hypothetical protein ACTXT7_002453 [Hymenolepis weldensis]